MKKTKRFLLALVIMLSVFIFCSTSFKTYAATKEESSNTTKSVSVDNWNYILSNVDIDIKYLEANKYLGLYWDSFVQGSPTDGYLYLCWISPYYTKTNNTILQFTEGSKKYNLYSTKEDMNNLNGNWLATSSKAYPNYDITIHMTPIGGIKDGQNFGIELKRTYNFKNFKYGYEGTNKVIGQCSEAITFDLGLIPKLDGKNSMQLCTHGYEIIENCEVQSYYDLFAYGGYGHFAYFNTTLNIDKIYRVDVAYKILNDNKEWYQFFLPDDEHQIKKSLTAERIRGGIFGLYQRQGFSQGSFKSTKDSSITYKYKLHLNSDDPWGCTVGQEYYEKEYKRVSEFQILRMNYVIDGETFDVPIKMDTIEGETLFILDDELILDTDSAYYDFKKQLDDYFAGYSNILDNLATNWDKYKAVIIIIACCIAGMMVLIPLLRFLYSMKLYVKKDKHKYRYRPEKTNVNSNNTNNNNNNEQRSKE